MTAHRDLGRRLADHFSAEAPRLAPDWVLPSALTTIESTPQRRGLPALRRFTPMPTFAKLGAAAAAVAVVAVALALSLKPNQVAAPQATPSTNPSPSAAAVRTSTPYTVPPLTQTFTSERFGISISYPEGWIATPARLPWTLDNGAYREPLGDLIADPLRDPLSLKMASLPLGDMTMEQLAAMAFPARSCQGTESAMKIDGADGLVDSSPNCLTAIVASGGRGYLIGVIWDYSLTELRTVDWSGWFEDVLATVHLDPDKAVDSK